MPRLPIALATSVLAALFLCLPSAAFAATCDFTGTGSWHIAANWSCTEVPDSGDSVNIGAGDDVSVAATASAGALSLTGGGFITFSGDVTLAASSMATGAADSNGTIRGPGQLTVAGAFSKTGTGQFSVTNNGAGPSADLILNGTATLSGGSMCVADTGDAHPDLPNLYINNTFTISTAHPQGAFPCTSGPRIHVNPSGHMIKSSAGTTLTDTGIENDGTVTAQNGTLSLGGPSSVDAPNGNATVTNDGDYIASAGATISFANSHSVSSHGRVGGAGTISIGHGSLSMAAGSTLDPAVLNLILTGSLTLDGTTAMTLPVLNFNGGGFNPVFDTDRPVTVTTLSVTERRHDQWRRLGDGAERRQLLEDRERDPVRHEQRHLRAERRPHPRRGRATRRWVDLRWRTAATATPTCPACRSTRTSRSVRAPTRPRSTAARTSSGSTARAATSSRRVPGRS